MQSIWTRTTLPVHPPLEGRHRCDAVVLGAGMAGILTAWFLRQHGLSVIVLEANRVGSGQTQNTTAKITAQHGLCYAKLIDRFGAQDALRYARAARQAVTDFRDIIAQEHIACHLETLPSYLYSRYDPTTLKQERDAACDLGFGAEFVKETCLPFPVEGAVVFPDQAQFHPLEFLRGVSEPLVIYEHSKVTDVSDHQVSTAHGTVTADHIIFATHVPFVNFPGFYFARLRQERSYVLALADAQKLDGTYVSLDADGLSLRNADNLLLLGGSKHLTGENRQGGRYEHLRSAAGKLWPGCVEVARWSAQDGTTPDNVPYIGAFAPSKPNWYVATGFRKWGMTGSMTAARLLTDLITGHPNPNGAIFSPRRFSAADLGPLAQEGALSCKGLTRQMLHVPQSTLDDLPLDHGGIVTVDGEKAGVYKNPQGVCYVVNPRCPHLGCQLEWNPDEKSWDCPCHGSRFDYQGNLLDNPALENLEPLP